MAGPPRSNRPTPRTPAAAEAELRRRIRAELADAREQSDGQLDDATLADIIARAVAAALGWHLEAPEHTRNATLSSRTWRPAGGPRGGPRPEPFDDRGPRDYADRGPRPFERRPREYDDRGARDRDFDRGPRDFDRGPRDFDRGPRDFDQGPRDFDRGPRGGRPGGGGGFSRGGGFKRGGFGPKRPPRKSSR